MNWQIINKKGNNEKLDVADIGGLLDEKILNLFSEIPGTSNATYGIAYHLKKYAGIDLSIPINCTLEHGLCFIGTVCQSEVSHHNSCILTISPFREKIITELTEHNPIVIGPYIAYVENYHSKEYIDKVRRKNGRTLLVMPSHSIQGMEAEYDIKYFIQEIEEAKQKFDTVIVCIYFEDLKKGIWKLYREKGYNIVSAGNTCSPYFLSRLKYIFSICDAVIANSATTGLAYAMHMHKPIRLVRQSINYNMTSSNNVLQLETESQIDNMYKFFGHKEFSSSIRQHEYANYIFGLNKVKSQEEMRNILLPLLRIKNWND